MEWQEDELEVDRWLRRDMKGLICPQAARGASDPQKCESQAVDGGGCNTKEVSSLGLYWDQL